MITDLLPCIFVRLGLNLRPWGGAATWGSAFPRPHSAWRSGGGCGSSSTCSQSWECDRQVVKVYLTLSIMQENQYDCLAHVSAK